MQKLDFFKVKKQDIRQKKIMQFMSSVMVLSLQTRMEKKTLDAMLRMHMWFHNDCTEVKS